MSSAVALPADSVIIHEGYLFKTPPLDKFFMSWKKRWFVLSRQTTPNSHTLRLDLSYYTDCNKKEKIKSIDTSQIKSINPVHNKAKENVFSLELPERKFVLRSPDKQGKAVWVAKLLECCSQDGSSFHVTVPNQPAASYAEGVLKLTTPIQISVISSFNGSAIMTIPYNKIRRLGCQVAIDSDIVWFETCSCHDEMEEFQFFLVASGIEKAYQIVQEYKRSIELALRDHLIMEEGDQSQFLYSYVVKSHYGHQDYSSIARERILQSGIMSLSTSGGSVSLTDLNKFARSRPPRSSLGATTNSRPSIGSINMIGGGAGFPGNTISPPPPGERSPSPSLPNEQRRMTKMTLEQLQRSPRNLRSNGFQSSAPEFDSGVAMGGELDPSRNSAPCYLSAKPVDRPGVNLSASLDRRGRGKSTLQDMRNTGKSFDETRHHRPSLAQLKVDGGLHAFNRPTRKSVDSAISSPTDNGGRSFDMGNHYNHLTEKVQDVSLHHNRGDDPYADL